MREQDWLSAHIFYHDELDPLVVKLVRPLVGELAAQGLAERFFFLRYWDGGSHVRLRLAPRAGQHAATRRRVEQRCAAYFRAFPAAHRVTPQEYAVQAAGVARQEGVVDYLRQLQPNNSVRFIPYRRECQRYGTGEAIEVVERHFVESSRIALRMLGAGIQAAHRGTAGVAMIMLAWRCAPPGVDDLIGAAAPPGGVRDAEARYHRQQHTLSRLAAQVDSIAADGERAGDDPGSGALAAWWRSVCTLRDGLGDNPASTRIVDTAAHLICNRLGVGLLEEWYLRFLAARTMLVHGTEGARCGLA